MLPYIRIPTSAEVAAVILARHPDIRVVAGSTDMERGRIVTAYGFDQAGCPLLEIEATWEPIPREDGSRRNERTAHWLCVPEMSE